MQAKNLYKLYPSGIRGNRNKREHNLILYHKNQFFHTTTGGGSKMRLKDYQSPAYDQVWIDFDEVEAAYPYGDGQGTVVAFRSGQKIVIAVSLDDFVGEWAGGDIGPGVERPIRPRL